MRNPEARARVAAQRQETARSLAEYITAHIEKIGGRMRIDPLTLARVLIATNEGITLASHIDGEDLYLPFLQMVIANAEPTSEAEDR